MVTFLEVVETKGSTFDLTGTRKVTASPGPTGSEGWKLARTSMRHNGCPRQSDHSRTLPYAGRTNRQEFDKGQHQKVGISFPDIDTTGSKYFQIISNLMETIK